MAKKKPASVKSAAEAERRSILERRAYELRFLHLLSVTQTADVINDELEAEGRKTISAATAWRYAQRHRAMLAEIEDASIEVKRRNRVAYFDKLSAMALSIAHSPEPMSVKDRVGALKAAASAAATAVMIEGSAAPVKTEAKVEVTMVDAKDLELARMLDVAPGHDVMVVNEGESA